VERSHGVFQERFVKELWLASISSISEANQLLEAIYIPIVNARLACPPAYPDNAHVGLGDANLREIMYFEEARVDSRNFIISFEKRLLQILPENHLIPVQKAKKL
jgi:hypothetical protein